MRKNIVFEPSILGLGTFLLYLGGPVVFFTMSVMAGCKAKGFCNAPLAEFTLLVVTHWVIVGFVLKRNLLLAKWLLIAFGSIPFLALSYFGIVHGAMGKIFWAVEVYLFFVGVLFCGYVWFSSEVKKYLDYVKS